MIPAAEDDDPRRPRPAGRRSPRPREGSGPDGGWWLFRARVPLAVAVALMQLFGTHAAAQHQSGRSALDPLGYTLLLLGPALLLVRSRFPVTVCAATTAVAAAYLLLGYPYGPVFVSVVIAFVGAVRAGRRRQAWLCAGGLYLVHLGASAASGSLTWGQELGMLAWLLLVVLLAEVIRSRAEQRAQRRQARAEREQRIADEQRLAIARELHDVLAHSISLINVQAGVALELIDDDPEQARTALATIKQTSKQALGEVRQVLGTLRGGAPTAQPPGTATATAAAAAASAPRTPAPDLRRLPELVAQAKDAGLDVELRTEGTAHPLPQGVELAGFRIVQEALTNVLRHSAARHAEVLLGYPAEGGLELTVRDPGPVSAAGGSRAGGSGSGLTGMRERAAALGGTVEAGPRPGGGFEVRAQLPAVGRAHPGDTSAARGPAGRGASGRGPAGRGAAGEGSAGQGPAGDARSEA